VPEIKRAELTIVNTSTVWKKLPGEFNLCVALYLQLKYIMNNLTAINEASLKEIIEINKEFIRIGGNCIQKFTEPQYSLDIFIYINYVERFTFMLESVNLLLGDYSRNGNHETSIGLILRTGLYDFMMASYLGTYLVDLEQNKDEQSESEYDNQLTSFAADHLRNNIAHVKHLRRLGAIEENEFRTIINNMKLSFEVFFEAGDIDYGSPEKMLKGNRLTLKEVHERLFKHRIITSAFPDKKFDVYDIYTYYSKYEHFGIMTRDMQGRGVNKDFEIMLTALWYFYRLLATAVTFIGNGNDVLEEEKVKLKNVFKKFDLSLRRRTNPSG
jgi:hypothetical protein